MPSTAAGVVPGKLPAVDRGEGQQRRAVADDPHVDPADKATWTEADYHRDSPEFCDVIYYAIQKNRRADARLRGGRFDWGCQLWFGDAAEPDSIKLLDAKYKRKPCQPARKWNTKELRYPLCYEGCEEKDDVATGKREQGASGSKAAVPSQWAPQFNAPGQATSALAPPAPAAAPPLQANVDLPGALARIDGLVASGALTVEFATGLKQDACRQHFLGN